MKVCITLTLELDEKAQEAWSLNYGVEKSDIREDVKTYVGSQITEDVFKETIGAPIKVTWK